MIIDIKLVIEPYYNIQDITYNNKKKTLKSMPESTFYSVTIKSLA